MCTYLFTNIEIYLFSYVLMYLCPYVSIIYLCTHVPKNIGRALFLKRVKRYSKKKMGCNANAKFDYYVLEKSFSHINKCVYNYIFMNRFFFQNMIPELDIAIAT